MTFKLPVRLGGITFRDNVLANLVKFGLSLWIVGFAAILLCHFRLGLEPHGDFLVARNVNMLSFSGDGIIFFRAKIRDQGKSRDQQPDNQASTIEPTPLTR